MNIVTFLRYFLIMLIYVNLYNCDWFNENINENVNEYVNKKDNATIVIMKPFLAHKYISEKRLDNKIQITFKIQPWGCDLNEVMKSVLLDLKYSHFCTHYT